MSSTAVDRLRRFASRATDHSTCDLCRSDLQDRHRHVLEVVPRRMLCACDTCALLFSDGTGSRLRLIPESVTRIDLKLSNAEWTGLGIPIGMAFFTVRESAELPEASPVDSEFSNQVTSPAQRARSDTVAAGRGPTKLEIRSVKQEQDSPPSQSVLHTSNFSRPLPGLRARPLPQAAEVTVNATVAAVMVGYPSPAGPVMSSVEHDDWRALLDANPDVSRLRPEVESLLINRIASRRQAFIVPLDVCFELIGIVRRHWDGWSGGPKVHREIDRFFDRLEISAGERVPS